MTVVVNTHSEQEEKVLLAFLDSLKYDYQTNDAELSLTDAQAEEILSRDKKFAEGKSTAKTWDEIKKELSSVYR